MSSSTSPVWAEERECQAMLSKLTKPSQTKILSLAKFSIKHARHYKSVVHLVERHIRRGSTLMAQMSGMYLLDAICRASKNKLPADKDVYKERFMPRVLDLCQFMVQQHQDEGQRIVRKLAVSWQQRAMFTPKLLDSILALADSLPPDDEEGSGDHPMSPPSSSSSSSASASSSRQRPSPSSQPPSKKPRVDAQSSASSSSSSAVSPPSSHHHDPRRANAVVNNTAAALGAPNRANGTAPPSSSATSSFQRQAVPFAQPQRPQQQQPSSTMRMPAVAVAPAAIAAFVDDYSDDDDEEDEEKRQARDRKRVEQSHAKLTAT